MHHRSIVGGLALLVAGMIMVSGCGDNDNHIVIGTCGNDVVDGNEDCDRTDLDGATCQSLGFTGGTLSCTSACRYNTSQCSGSTNRTPTPVVTATPAAGETATPAPVATETIAANPTATPTPSGGPVCDGSESIVVAVSIAGEYTGARVDLAYPASANIPGSGSTDQSVKDRIVIAPSGGLTVKNDADSGSDGIDDTATASFVGQDVVPAGLFVTVTFDCVAGQPEPTAGAFACTVVSASLSGVNIDPPPACSVALE